MEDRDDKPPPSLDLAFDWVRGVLHDQARTADVLDTKAATFFSIATVVLGVGIPVTFSGSESVPAPVLALSGLAMFLYLSLACFAIQALRIRKYETLDDPAMVRKYYWDVEPDRFKTEVLTHMEDAFKRNDCVLRTKANAVRTLPYLAGAQVLSQAVSIVLLAACGG